MILYKYDVLTWVSNSFRDLTMIFIKCLVLTLCWVSLVRSQSELQSRRPISPAIKVSVISVRNKTGHWTTELTLDHDNEMKSLAATGLVKIEPRTPSCGEDKSMYSVKITISTPPPNPKVAGYELLPGLGNYKFHTAAATWPRAREVCEEEGGHLVIVNSEEESKAMVKLFARHPNAVGAQDNSVAWAGIKESDTTNGQFFTVFGEPLSTTGYTRWHAGQPTGTIPGDFLWIARSDGGWGVLPAAPNYKYAFICEQDIC